MSTHATSSGQGDSIGIPISRDAFQKRATALLDEMVAGAPLGVQDWIDAARTWNTILFRRESVHYPHAERFASTFFPGSVERAARALGALPSKGMALYSKAHDVYIGGTPHANSLYTITEDDTSTATASR